MQHSSLVLVMYPVGISSKRPVTFKKYSRSLLSTLSLLQRYLPTSQISFCLSYLPVIQPRPSQTILWLIRFQKSTRRHTHTHTHTHTHKHTHNLRWLLLRQKVIAHSWHWHKHHHGWNVGIVHKKGAGDKCIYGMSLWVTYQPAGYQGGTSYKFDPRTWAMRLTLRLTLRLTFPAPVACLK